MIWLVLIGGGLGALARYELGGWVQEAAGASFPWIDGLASDDAEPDAGSPSA